jgi:multidrug efflux pump subunit AcrB
MPRPRPTFQPPGGADLGAVASLEPRLALTLGHMDLSVIGIIGIILLIGIVKKNGIMLVDFAIVAERDRNLPPIAAM